MNKFPVLPTSQFCVMCSFLLPTALSLSSLYLSMAFASPKPLCDPVQSHSCLQLGYPTHPSGEQNETLWPLRHVPGGVFSAPSPDPKLLIKVFFMDEFFNSSNSGLMKEAEGEAGRRFSTENVKFPEDMKKAKGAVRVCQRAGFFPDMTQGHKIALAAHYL